MYDQIGRSIVENDIMQSSETAHFSLLENVCCQLVGRQVAFSNLCPIYLAENSVT